LSFAPRHPALVSCPANSLDSSRRSLDTEQAPGGVARPYRTMGYALGRAPCLPPDFIPSFIFGIHGTGH
jgi:hypothetical protein